MGLLVELFRYIGVDFDGMLWITELDFEAPKYFLHIVMRRVDLSHNTNVPC